MTVSENASKRSFVWPADYYSSPTPESVLPKWVTFGCGAASIAALIIIFAVGAWLATGGMTDLIGFVIGTSASEISRQYADDVPDAQKKAISDELDAVVRHLRANELTVVQVQPFLQRLREVSADQKITRAEATGLETLLKGINSKRAAKAKRAA